MVTEPKARIVIADDNAEALFALEELLKSRGYEVFSAESGREALKLIRAEEPDLILSDVVMAGGDGFELARTVKTDLQLRYIPLVLVTSKDNLEDVLEGFSQGADDYIKKPYRPEELLTRISAALRTRKIYQELRESNNQNRELRTRLGEQFSFGNIIGNSGSMRAVFDVIEKVAGSHVPVLVTGESGTGKELIASAVHYNSPRKDLPLIIQNCAAFSEQLLESELFGHVKGAFTGAARDKQGLFEAADGGTFFLDEIGEMSPTLQAKLLRVLQDGTFTPVGSTKQKKVDVRIVAATNRDVPAMIKAGSFREDLYYRINVVNIKLPPLRDRRPDIPLLIGHFLQRHSKRHGAVEKLIADATLQALAAYDWPGNIRELENEIERMILMSGSALEIGTDHLSPNVLGGGDRLPSSGATGGGLKEALERLERDLILAALERNGWNKSEVARELGISRSNLIAKVQAYGLEK